jgi:hypothetical protein
MLAVFGAIVAGIALPALVLIYGRRPTDGPLSVTEGLFWDSVLGHWGTQLVNASRLAPGPLRAPAAGGHYLA